MEQLLARLTELKAEGDAIMQQLMQAGMPAEQIMAAVEGAGQQAQPMPQPGMGPAFDPSAGVPGGPEAQPFPGPQGPMNGGPRGLLGAV